MAMKKNAAVLFDKDGTLIPDIPYNIDATMVELRSGIGPVLGELARRGYALAIVSNQSGVARGLFGEDALASVWERLQELASAYGARFSAFYYCPHHPAGSVADYALECDCRKPKSGLVERALRELNADPRSSWMIGDTLDDIEAGARAGLNTALIQGGETEWLRGPYRSPGHIIDVPRDLLNIIPSSARRRRYEKVHV